MSNKPYGPSIIVSWTLLFSIKWENVGQKLFFTWKIAFFFQKLVFSTTSWVLTTCSHNDRSFCQNTLWTRTNCPMRFVKLVNTRKKGPQFFPHWKNCLLFQRIVFSTTSQVLKKRAYNFHSKCQKFLWTIITCSRWFVTNDKTMKGQPKSSVTMRTANFLFWKSSCNRPVRSQRKNFISCKIIVKHTLWTLKKGFLIFVMLDKVKKSRPKSFVHWKDCLFFTKSCVSNNLLCPEELLS